MISPVIVISAVFLFLLILVIRFSPSARFRRVFGKFPAQMSEKEIQTVFNELCLEYNVAKSKYDEYLEKSKEGFIKKTNIYNEDESERTIQRLELNLNSSKSRYEKAVKIMRNLERITGKKPDLSKIPSTV